MSEEDALRFIKLLHNNANFSKQLKLSRAMQQEFNLLLFLSKPESAELYSFRKRITSEANTKHYKQQLTNCLFTLLMIISSATSHISPQFPTKGSLPHPSQCPQEMLFFRAAFWVLFCLCNGMLIGQTAQLASTTQNLRIMKFTLKVKYNRLARIFDNLVCALAIANAIISVKYVHNALFCTQWYRWPTTYPSHQPYANEYTKYIHEFSMLSGLTVFAVSLIVFFFKTQIDPIILPVDNTDSRLSLHPFIDSILHKIRPITLVSENMRHALQAHLVKIYHQINLERDYQNLLKKEGNQNMSQQEVNCPITLERIHYPVWNQNNPKTGPFELFALTTWLEINNKCPLSRESLTLSQLVPNLPDSHNKKTSEDAYPENTLQNQPATTTNEQTESPVNR